MEPSRNLCVYRSVRRRDREDFEELYAAWYPRLAAEFALVAGSRSLGEDCANEAFTRLVVHWDKVSGYDKPVSWVRNVGYRLAIDEHRRQARPVPLPEVDPSTATDQHATTGELQAVWQAIRQLPPHQRAVLIRRAVHDLSDAEIGTDLDIPTGTVKSRLSRARSALRQIIGDTL
ncbi:RNA polymerase sigma factor [Janibacter limosus]|uniref:RNA polymerase sigma factor n=1 Tax=Janibacter limosus TaxID=53458 RepID=UPI0035E106D4